MLILPNAEPLEKWLSSLWIAVLFCDGISFALKHMIHEPRPFMSLDNVHLLITEDDLNSFPSGHTTTTVALVVSLILNMKELSEKHYLIIDIALMIFAVIISFSRMYVGVTLFRRYSCRCSCRLGRCINY